MKSTSYKIERWDEYVELWKPRATRPLKKDAVRMLKDYRIQFPTHTYRLVREEVTREVLDV